MRVSQNRPKRSLALGMAATLAIFSLLAAAPAAAQSQRCSSELCVAKSFKPGQVSSGGTTTLRMTFSNVDGFGNAISNITFTDFFPAGMTLVGAAANQCGGIFAPLAAANGFGFTNGFLDVGQSCVITATVSVVGLPGAKLVNSIKIIDYDYDDGSTGSVAGVAGSVTIIGGGRPPAITSPPPTDGMLAIPYGFQVAVAGTPPITVAASGLPPGLSLDPSTLIISGTPTLVGTFRGTITASNAFKPDALQSFTIVIGVPPLQIITPPTVFANPVNAGTPLDVTLQAQGGVSPYTWDLAGGGLPPGVTLGGNGHLIGTATAAGTYNFTAGVTDSLGTRTTQAYSIVVGKAEGGLQVTTSPSPVISGQTLTVTISLIGPVPATGTVEVWVAGSTTSCPARFKFGNPANPVAALRTAPMDATGKARVLVANLPIDDYGVCVHYSGDALYSEAFAGPIDAFVIKGVLLSAPAVALAAPARAKANSSVGVDVTVTPVDTTLMPVGAVEIRRDGQAVATVELQDGVAHATVAGPGDAGIEVSALYMGDGTFAPAASPAAIILPAGVGTAIPTLSEMLLALLAILLGFFAAQRLRR